MIERGVALVVRRGRDAFAAFALRDGVLQYAKRDFSSRNRLAGSIDEVNDDRSCSQRRIFGCTIARGPTLTVAGVRVRIFLVVVAVVRDLRMTCRKRRARVD